MKKLIFAATAALLMVCLTFTANAQCSGSSHAKSTSKKVHNYSSDVVDIAINSPVHTTLVAAVKAADLVGTLKSDGPFTVFAPTDDAFNALPDGTIPTLLKPNNKGQLSSILTYHVIAGTFKAADVVKAIELNGGSVTLTTVQGGSLTAMLKGGKVWLKDATGAMARVTATDLVGSNGVVHVIDRVIMPKVSK